MGITLDLQRGSNEVGQAINELRLSANAVKARLQTYCQANPEQTTGAGVLEIVQTVIKYSTVAAK